MKTWLLLLFAAGAAAAQTTTTVTGMLTDPSGDPVSGSCLIQPVAAFTETPTGWRVTGAPMTVRFTSGAFSATLAPTDTTSPTGQYYKVTCAIPQQTANGRSVGPFSWGPRYWTVPTSSTPLDISVVEANPPPPGLATGASIIAAIGYTPENVANKGAANGYAPLDANHLVPAANVPGLTGDVIKNGGANATTVAAIRNYPVTPNAPADGQLMRWSASAGQWTFVSLVDQEVMAGTIDGTNATFTLANTPAPASSLIVKINGLEEQQGDGCYSLSGNTVTFSTVCIPQPGDVPMAKYRY